MMRTKARLSGPASNQVGSVPQLHLILPLVMTKMIRAMNILAKACRRLKAWTIGMYGVIRAIRVIRYPVVTTNYYGVSFWCEISGRDRMACSLPARTLPGAPLETASSPRLLHSVLAASRSDSVQGIPNPASGIHHLRKVPVRSCLILLSYVLMLEPIDIQAPPSIQAPDLEAD